MCGDSDSKETGGAFGTEGGTVPVVTEPETWAVGTRLRCGCRRDTQTCGGRETLVSLTAPVRDRHQRCRTPRGAGPGRGVCPVRVQRGPAAGAPGGHPGRRPLRCQQSHVLTSTWGAGPLPGGRSAEPTLPWGRGDVRLPLPRRGPRAGRSPRVPTAQCAAPRGAGLRAQRPPAARLHFQNVLVVSHTRRTASTFRRFHRSLHVAERPELHTRAHTPARRHGGAQPGGPGPQLPGRLCRGERSQSRPAFWEVLPALVPAVVPTAPSPVHGPALGPARWRPRPGGLCTSARASTCVPRTPPSVALSWDPVAASRP